VRVSRLCALYRGRFIPDESSQGIERARERLHRLFVRQVLTLGTRLRALRAWRDLESLYEHAAELDPLGDEIHANLVEALIAQEKMGAAHGVYSRYRSRLARSSRALPSPLMQRLFEKLK
jgi:two-component SAPR family response regulator